MSHVLSREGIKKKPQGRGLTKGEKKEFEVYLKVNCESKIAQSVGETK